MSASHRRPMGYGELLWWRVSEAGSTNAVIVADIEGQIDPNRMLRAIRQASLAIPMLRAIGQKSDSGSAFAFSPHAQSPLTILPRQSEHHWRDVAEQELSAAVPHDAIPLWRIVLLHGPARSELIFTFNHAICDGLSGTLVIEQILRAYSGPRAMGGHGAPPPAFDRLVDHGGWMPLLGQITRYLWSQIARPVAARLPAAHGVDPSQPMHTRLIEWTIDASTTARLAEHCKARGQSMNELLSGVLLLAARGVMPHSGALSLAMSSAINVRPLLTQALPQAVGYYVTGVEGDYAVWPDSDPWALGQQAGEHTRRHVTPAHVALNSLLRRFILALKPDGRSLIATAPRTSRACVHLSNLGRLQMASQYGTLRLRRCFHIGGVNLAQRPYICLAAVTFDGAMQLSFTYCAPITSYTLVQSVVDRCKGLLTDIAQTPWPHRPPSGADVLPLRRKVA